MPKYGTLLTPTAGQPPKVQGKERLLRELPNTSSRHPHTPTYTHTHTHSHFAGKPVTMYDVSPVMWKNAYQLFTHLNIPRARTPADLYGATTVSALSTTHLTVSRKALALSRTCASPHAATTLVYE